MLDFGKAAKDITERLTGRFEVDDDSLKEWLAGDIVDRCARCAAIITGLMEDGMPADRLNFVFFWTQFMAAHGADEQWRALEDERDRLFDELPPVRPDRPDETHPAVVGYRAADAAFIARGHELQRAFKPHVVFADTLKLARRGERLANANDIASLLTRYGQLDLLVERLEDATMSAARAWDQLVEDAVSRAREE